MLYFDHNATTPVLPEIADLVGKTLRDIYGNPSSIHTNGQVARRELERARRSLGGALGAAATEIVFTSGGTEANNLAVLGLARSFAGLPRHVVTTTIEHPAVLEACRELAREGVEVTFVGVDPSGTVNPEEIAAAIRADTVLVSVMHANNETGSIQPIEEIGSVVRARRAAGQNIYFHSDGVQALGKVPANVRELEVDFYSISAHKVFAPKGTGALFVRKGAPLRTLFYGGRHERGHRAGTENVAGAMAFARAVELSDAHAAFHLSCLRDELERLILSSAPFAEVNGIGSKRLPNTSNIMLPGISAEALVIALDLQGIAISTGSACSSGSVEPSHVLLAMGRSYEEAKSCIRVSFGRYQSEEDTRALADAILSFLLRTPSASASALNKERRVAV